MSNTPSPPSSGSKTPPAHINISESPGFASALSFVAGALNAWALMNGGAFATSQTGNLVASALYLALGQWPRTLFVVGSVLAFGLGAFTSTLIMASPGRQRHYAAFVLHGQAALITGVALLWALGAVPPNILWAHGFSVIIAFVAGMQANTFHKVVGLNFGNVSITPELQSFFNNLGLLAIERVKGNFETHSVSRAWTLRFLAILTSFGAGAGVGALLGMLGGWPPDALPGTPVAGTGWSLLLPAGVTAALGMYLLRFSPEEIQAGRTMPWIPSRGE